MEKCIKNSKTLWFVVFVLRYRLILWSAIIVESCFARIAFLNGKKVVLFNAQDLCEWDLLLIFWENSFKFLRFNAIIVRNLFYFHRSISMKSGVRKKNVLINSAKWYWNSKVKKKYSIKINHIKFAMKYVISYLSFNKHLNREITLKHYYFLNNILLRKKKKNF